MKNMKRASRRYEKEVHQKRRAGNYYFWFCNHNDQSWASFWNEVSEGIRCRWMKTTGNPCNCYDCTELYKYIRTPLHIIQREINEQLEENKI